MSVTEAPRAPRRAKGAAAVSVAALSLATVMVASHEGIALVPYIDRLGKGQPVTVCYGETRGVIAGRRYSKAECDAMLKARVLQHAVEAQACLPQGLPTETAAAFYDFAYNVGSTTFCRSSVARKAAVGDLKGACRAIGLFVYSNGKDCRNPASRCSGIVTRRNEEVRRCLGGLA